MMSSAGKEAHVLLLHAPIGFHQSCASEPCKGPLGPQMPFVTLELRSVTPKCQRLPFDAHVWFHAIGPQNLIRRYQNGGRHGHTGRFEHASQCTHFPFLLKAVLGDACAVETF